MERLKIASLFVGCSEEHDVSAKSAMVRVARGADSGRICELLAVLGYPTRSDDVGRALSEPGVTVLVAEVGSVVVGVLVGGARWQLHYGSTTGSIDALVVDAAFRTAGLGAALVHAFVEILDRDGASRVEVHSNARRTRAHRIYERLGFQSTSVYFVRDLTHLTDEPGE